MSKKKKDEQSENDGIIKSFESISERLEKQITLIVGKQQELQNYLVMIDNHIMHFDQMIQQEMQSSQPDYKKINSYRSASFKNIELMSVLHTTFKGYEEVKFRYFKEISDSNYKQQRLISVDIKRVGTSEDMGQEFYEIMRSLSKLNIVGNEAQHQIAENSQMLNTVKEGLTGDEYEM